MSHLLFFCIDSAGNLILSYCGKNAIKIVSKSEQQILQWHIFSTTVDAGYKHIVGNCINVLITGINYIGIYGNRFSIYVVFLYPICSYDRCAYIRHVLYKYL